MRMRSALAGFALLASASVALAAGPSKEMRGEITKVTPSAHELVVKSGAAPHEDVTFEVPRGSVLDLGCADDPRGMLEHALSVPGPFLVNVPIAADENVYPMVEAGKGQHEMRLSPFQAALRDRELA